ncbi:ERVV2 protein, partial [Crocuta crocuta]
VLGFTSFGKSLLSWSGTCTNEAMMRNLSLTPKSIAESAVKVTGPQQKSSGSVAKVALDNRVALENLLAERGGVCVVANTTCYMWMTLLGKLKLSYTRLVNE